MTEMKRDPREGWTQWEKDEYDARADHEAWEYAWSVLNPLVQATREIGSNELTRVMEKALAEVEGEVGRALDVLEPLQERGEA